MDMLPVPVSPAMDHMKPYAPPKKSLLRRMTVGTLKLVGGVLAFPAFIMAVGIVSDNPFNPLSGPPKYKMAKPAVVHVKPDGRTTPIAKAAQATVRPKSGPAKGPGAAGLTPAQAKDALAQIRLDHVRSGIRQSAKLER